METEIGFGQQDVFPTNNYQQHHHLYNEQKQKELIEQKQKEAEQNPWLQYVRCIDLENSIKSTNGAQKQALHKLLEQELIRTSRSSYSPDGKHFFTVQSSKTTAPKITNDLLKNVYKELQRRKNRDFNDNEADEFVALLEEVRQMGAKVGGKKKMKFSESRPIDVFFPSSAASSSSS